MTLNFLPGQPNNTPDSCCFVNWNTIQILTYTSGNNLVILTKNSLHLQTLYLPSDSFAVDVNRVNGKIAIAIKDEVHIYSPEVSNYYNFNFHGRKDLSELKIQWSLEHKITNDNHNDNDIINCLCWSDYTQVADSDSDDAQIFDLPSEFNSKTSCELITGSNNSLKMHQMSYVADPNTPDNKIMKCSLMWYKPQPNPIYKVKISPNSTCIASIGYYDKNVKLWHRVGFTNEYCDFELHYLSQETYVTDLIWKSQMNESDPNNSSSISSVQITPSNSFILKPSNSIIKNDVRLLTENNSIHSNIKSEHQHNVLYIVTADSRLKVYSTYRLDTGFDIFYSGSLDLFENDTFKKSKGITKSITFIDNPYLELGLEKMLSDLENEHDYTELNHSMRKQTKMMEFIKSKSELCMVIGSDGEIDLYGFTNLCSVVPSKMITYKIDKLFHNNEFYKVNLFLGKYCLPSIPENFLLKSIQIDHYSPNLALSLVIHDLFHNTIREIGFTFNEIFNFEKSTHQSNKKILKTITRKIGCLNQKFTGHNKSVRKLIRSSDGSSILSLTRFTENYLWIPIYLSDDKTTLTKKSTIITKTPVIDAVIWNRGHFVFTIVDNYLIAFHTSTSNQHNLVSEEVRKIEINTDTPPECLFILPESNKLNCHLILIYKTGVCKSFEFDIKVLDSNSTVKGHFLHCEFGNITCSLTECMIDDLRILDKEDLHIISPIDPVGWGKNIDNIGRDVLATVSPTGRVSIYYVTFTDDDNNDLNNHSTIKWHLKDSFKTGISNCSFISGSSINKMAIIDESKQKLSIWDMKLGIMDYSEIFENEIVKDLDWTSTTYGQGILAVGFKSHSLLFTQLRYDYTNKIPSFTKIKKIDISDETTHQIGDSIWMSNGLLVIGTGNQLYLSDKKLDFKNDPITKKVVGSLEIMSNDLLHLSSALNGPLPLYHPQFIIQLLFGERRNLINKILTKLSRVLREIDLGQRKEDDFDLGISKEEIMLGDNSTDDDDNEDEKFSSECADILIEKLTKIRLPFLTGHQQITLTHTVSIMKDILLKYFNVLDFNGLKFYLGMKLFKVNQTKESAVNAIETIRFRDILFALHSDNRDILFDIVNEQSNSKIDWVNAKRYLLPLWLDNKKLQQTMEIIAANEFIKFQDLNNGNKDPSVCSIFYLALHKKKVLLGLWKNSIGHREREKMVKFLSNDFKEKRWKSAALKNAYVLLGKHRYNDAATFFLLADSPKDAVNVIMRQMNDLPLAIAVSRCYEDCDYGDSMKSILERGILKDAIINNDRWKLSWVFWILKNKSKSAQALIKPLTLIKDDLIKLLPNFQCPDLSNVIRTNFTEDPVLLILYNSLRKRNVLYYEGIKEMDCKYEFSFVMKSSTMYFKMGCDWLGLYLIKNWKFSEVDLVKDVKVKEIEEVKEVRKKPGDILAKFMNGSKNGSKSSKVPSMLDEFQPKSILDDFQPKTSQRRSLLDDFQAVPTPKPKSMLDDFQPQNTVQPKSMLDDFTKPTEPKKTTIAKKAPVANMLDNWM